MSGKSTGGSAVKRKVLVSDAEKRALDRFRESLLKIFGKRLKSFILFGSRARGEGTPESDLDVLLVIKNLARGEKNRVFENSAEISLEEGVVLSTVIFDEIEYESQREFPFLSTVEAEGYMYDLG
jgi:predicted nucleotidyltransferase